jgi:hypothetical protein
LIILGFGDSLGDFRFDKLRAAQALMSRYTSLLSATVFLILAIACKLKMIPMETNFALFGALSIFCGAYLRGFSAWLIPLFGIALSDLLGEWLQVSGVYRYDVRSMLFNYAGFAAMVGIGHALRRKDTADWVLGSALAGSVAFFLISNFGAWIDPLLKYELSWTGLLNCYAMAIPFFRYTLASDVLFTILFVGAYRGMLAYYGVTARVSSES